MPTPTTTYLDATGTAAKQRTAPATIVIGERRFARADLDGMRSALDMLNERAKAAAAEARRAALAFGEAWLTLRSSLPKRDFETVVGGLAINRKTLGKRIRLALRAGNGAGGWDAEKVQALRADLVASTPAGLRAEIAQHRAIVGDVDRLTVTDVEVLLGERPLSNIIGRRAELATRVASVGLDNRAQRQAHAADADDDFDPPAPAAFLPMAENDQELGAEEEDDALWEADGRPGRVERITPGDTDSLSPHVARATAAPTDARGSCVAEGGAAPLSPSTPSTPSPPVRHAAARASGPAPVQATFAELYQQAERVRRFADQVQRGEVGAEHLARVMAAIGGGE
ncbi:MAG: hypothetical protein IOD15_09190 [Phycisphaerales bacterium]|nr:hypothetical protein [Phycisphaerales bacterium]